MIRLLRLLRLFAARPTIGGLPCDIFARDVQYHSSMAQLLIRDVPEALVLALKERATANGRSAEAVHRLILEEALRSSRNCSASPPAHSRQEQGESAGLIL